MLPIKMTTCLFPGKWTRVFSFVELLGWNCLRNWIQYTYINLFQDSFAIVVWYIFSCMKRNLNQSCGTILFDLRNGHFKLNLFPCLIWMSTNCIISLLLHLATLNTTFFSCNTYNYYGKPWFELKRSKLQECAKYRSTKVLNIKWV